MSQPRPIKLSEEPDARYSVEVFRCLARDSKLVDREVRAIAYSREDLHGAMQVILSAARRIEISALRILADLEKP